MAGKYFVKLEHFEGPLDLLLHLIRVHELSIFNIDLMVLTSQYLRHLRLIKFRDIKDAAVFMEMAATLIQIKSRSLLPATDDAAVTEEDQEDQEDLASTLHKRLLAYECFRNIAEFLASIPSGGQLCCPSAAHLQLEEQYESTVSPLRGDPATLLILYEQMLTTLAERRPVTVKAMQESIKVEDITIKVAQIIETKDTFLFQSLYPKMENRYELVAWILAILQLVRDRELKIYQDDIMGPIWLYHHRLSEQQQLPFTVKPSSELDSPAI